MRFNDLPGIDWDSYKTTLDWTKLLAELIALAETAKGVAASQRDTLSDALDEFANHSSSPDLDAIIKLDLIARKTARAMRIEDIETSISELQAASSEFRGVVRELGAATATLQKEASKLRAEKLVAAISSLTEAISSLKSLGQAVAQENDEKLSTAIQQTVLSAQRLRVRLES